jgi:hypothetical protein
VHNFASRFGIPKTLPHNYAMRRFRLFPLLIFTLLLGFLSGSVPARPVVQNPPATYLAPGVAFAIADFDGDLLPDLISIQTGANGSAGTNYWIQLQLSAVGKQSIRLVAPMGGLSIEARDVNGDHAIDLVLATAWSRKPIAIFLNDGHGNFSRVEPADFPGVFSEFPASWTSSLALTTDAVGLPTQTRDIASRESRVTEYSPLRSRSLSTASAGFIFDTFLISHAGRAPPTEVPHL